MKFYIFLSILILNRILAVKGLPKISREKSVTAMFNKYVFLRNQKLESESNKGNQRRGIWNPKKTGFSVSSLRDLTESIYEPNTCKYVKLFRIKHKFLQNWNYEFNSLEILDVQSFLL